MKKYLIPILSIFLISSHSSLAFYADVPSSHEHFEALNELYDADLLPKDQASFQPDSLLNLEDFFEMLFTYAGIEVNENLSNPYSQKATELGLFAARGSQGLDTNIKLSKNQILEISFKTLGIGTPFAIEESSFPFIDVKFSSRVSPTAFKAALIGILEENPSSYRTGKRITKGEFANYLYKIQEFDPAETPTIEIKRTQNTSTTKNSQLEKDLPRLSDVWTLLNQDYIDKSKLNTGELDYAAAKALIDALDDPYTVFNTPEEAKAFFNRLSGEYEGVGMLIDQIEDDIVIVSPFKNSPAERAGLEPNDIIIKVNDISVIGKTPDATSELIRGDVGTTVKVTVLRNGRERSFNVTRELIVLESVESEVITTADNKNIGYINIVNFDSNSPNKFAAAAEKILESEPEGFIIDVRNNPGGFLNAAVNIASHFTDTNKTIVTLEYADNQKEKLLARDRTPDLSDYKVVLLVNEGSASASEILAGALRDLQNAQIIGQKTFGKGSVQSVTSLEDGSLLKYTISRWLTPNGTSINEVGIMPDQVVENSESTDWQLDTALELF